jgi:exonuclease SbcD
MKILHTSDWHLGHSLYNYDRSEEQSQMLEQMERIVESEKPDVFLLSGDVYHTTQPSSATQTMFTNAMVRIHEAHPDMVIVVTAGNHDSGAKHDIFQTPWRALKVFTVGTLEKEQLDNHIIHIEGKGYVVAIPYSYERNIPDGFFQGLLDEICLTNSPPTINSNEFRTVTIVESLQLFYLMFSSNNCAHIDYILPQR